MCVVRVWIRDRNMFEKLFSNAIDTTTEVFFLAKLKSTILKIAPRWQYSE